MKRIELDITEYCDYACTACVRSCGQAPSDKRMTIQQVETFVEDSIKLKWDWEHIRIIGGEPTTHPELFEIIDVIRDYKEFNPNTKFFIMSHGGEKIEKNIFPKIPSWMIIQSTAIDKRKVDQGHDVAFNVAPIDVGEWDTNNLVKCTRMVKCGMGLTRDGYFACHNAGGIHRVMGLGKGIMRLEEVDFAALNDLFPLSCKFCGFYFETGDRYKKYHVREITKSWKNAYALYKNASEG